MLVKKARVRDIGKMCLAGVYLSIKSLLSSHKTGREEHLLVDPSSIEIYVSTCR